MSRQHQGNGLPRPSQIASGFGFVTPKDRAEWEQARQQQQESGTRSAAAEFVTSSIAAASELGREGIQAKLRAAHQVAAQEERDQTKQVRRTITQVETVDIQERDGRTLVEEGFEF
ncbi:hypothetical protein F1D05_09595 [Kribbella qitaiheensis]|uniref:Uncharacterized protein n=1 Tax=Kribbella qitaiheensis TaxID=1544730 RepID=A0A7G6WVS8_9ACTN|nr:hypothetical protein [Kribbella qitaiheensis]QNE18093.1 hypothetical protein F1D05_09595 [Kribbella qitaiheensis]